MPIVKVADDAGDCMTFLDIGGNVYYPMFSISNPEDQIKSIVDWPARHDDILICAYPKSGTHWVWEILQMLLHGKAERIQGIKERVMLEAITQTCYNKLPSPRLLNSHIYCSQLPCDIKDKKCKIVYILRNPKDVAVSYYHHILKFLKYEYQGEWKNFLPTFIQGKVPFGSWFDYTLKWKDVIDDVNLPVHVMLYEDVKKNCVNEMRRLASFLEIKEDTELFEAIAAACDFKKMKPEKDSMENVQEWRDDKPGMYRKGEVGDWKNWFTVAQNEMFDAIYDAKMKDFNVNVQF